MTDLLGPANAVNFTTTRPGDTRIFGSADTFFKDCSSPSARDGTAVQAAFLNGMVQQLRRAIRGMSIAENNADDDMLLKAIQAARNGLLTEVAAMTNMPIVPGAGPDGLLVTTTSIGQIVVSTGQGVTRRGLLSYDLTYLSAGNRTFNTSPNKTYHLRWEAPGIGSASPASSWPVGRLSLRDLADPTYNPSSLAETNSIFDTTYDNALLARVVTNGSNVLTVTTLYNLPWLYAQFTRLPTKPASSFVQAHTLNFSRSPRLMLAAINPPGGGRDTDAEVYTQSQSRYSATIFARCWSDEEVAGTGTAPSYGYSMIAEA